MRIIKIFFLLSVVLGACSEEQMLPGEGATSPEATFRLHEAEYSGDAGSGRYAAGGIVRSISGAAGYNRLEHYIVDADGNPVTNVRSLYNANISQIKAEGLRDGEYELLVLAVRGDADADDALIRVPGNITGQWLAFRNVDEGAPLNAEYYYARHAFGVFDGKIMEQDVKLTRIVGKIEFSLNYANDYVRSSITSVSVVPDDSSVFAAALNAGGTIAGERRTESFAVPHDGGSFLLLPLAEGSVLGGKAIVKSRRHTGELIERSFAFKVEVRANCHSQVNINVTHPDDKTGMLYVRRNYYRPENFHTILSDDETKDVYYNNSLRSFHINEPLQVSVVDGCLQLRFYSPVAISNVSLYTKLPSQVEYMELAFVDSLPAFGNVMLDLPMRTKETVFRMESGKYVSLPAREWDDLSALEFKIVSDDPYWQKIMRIRAKWLISFNSYGGDPDADDGAPAGNWMGIRPVHIREAVALMTNIAYLCTLDAYAAKLEALQGVVMGNDGQTPVDMSKIIPKLENHSRFNMGLVYIGNGVVGLGGGATLGVYQGTYLTHYSFSYVLGVMFHELGHCMGYGHSSGMTYGRFSGDSGDCYIENLPNLPVPVNTILNSNNNPNKY